MRLELIVHATQSRPRSALAFTPADAAYRDAAQHRRVLPPIRTDQHWRTQFMHARKDLARYAYAMSFANRVYIRWRAPVGLWKIFWIPAGARCKSASVAARFSRMTFVLYGLAAGREFTEEA
jgi:hypothetical protein